MVRYKVLHHKITCMLEYIHIFTKNCAMSKIRGSDSSESVNCGLSDLTSSTLVRGYQQWMNVLLPCSG
jgi:hypothetical protein